MGFQILAPSGGGFLGLYTACILAELEDFTGRPIADSFDLLAGTSVGGIIALGLAARKPAKEIRNAFIKNGPQIFSANPPPQSWVVQKFSLLNNATRPRYQADELKKTIEQIVGADSKVGELK